MELSSIIIPHYQTPDYLEFCLLCLKHFTTEPHEIIVVDNGSDKATVSSLKARDDIVLIERKQASSLDQEAHKAALDLGISKATGTYLIAIHSDTFIIRHGWVKYLIERLQSGNYLACGPYTHHLYPPSLWERFKKRFNEGARFIRPVFTIYHPEIFKEKCFMDFKDVGHLTEPYVQSGKAYVLSRKEAVRWAFHAGGTTKLTLLRHRRKAKRHRDKLYRRLFAQKEIRELTKSGSVPFQ